MVSKPPAVDLSAQHSSTFFICYSPSNSPSAPPCMSKLSGCRPRPRPRDPRGPSGIRSPPPSKPHCPSLPTDKVAVQPGLHIHVQARHRRRSKEGNFSKDPWPIFPAYVVTMPKKDASPSSKEGHRLSRGQIGTRPAESLFTISRKVVIS